MIIIYRSTTNDKKIPGPHKKQSRGRTDKQGSWILSGMHEARLEGNPAREKLSGLLQTKMCGAMIERDRGLL